ncbi:hypothetical protein SESBI_16203 [Sesbania bispinosa]|nr:hypothetical protein SESBI_16203 [Sesbania bispinosa]
MASSANDDNPRSVKKVAVVGAGVSGLAAAYKLKSHGLDVTVFEAEGRAGGRLRSISQDGLVWDEGANTMTESEMEVKSLIDALGLQQQFPISQHKRYIVKNGTPLLVPTNPAALLKSTLLSAQSKSPKNPRTVTGFSPATGDVSPAAIFPAASGSSPADCLRRLSLLCPAAALRSPRLPRPVHRTAPPASPPRAAIQPATSSSSPANLRCVGEREFSPPPPLRSPCSGDPSAYKENWEKTDALLCTLLWQSIDPSLHNIYTNFDTCYDLWTQAKSLYTNDIQRLYSVVEKLINSRQQNMTVSEIVGHMSSIKAEYNALLPAGKTAAEDLAQRDKFFMVCTLAILNTDLVSVRDQILASPSIPTLDEVFSRLLRVASIPPSGPIPNAHDTSALISTNAQHGHREEQGGPYRGGSKTSRPKCTYCHRWGHTKEKCFKLHGRPPRANLAHIDDTLPEQPRDLPVQQSVTLTGTDYDDYLRSSATSSLYSSPVL